ncbi:MAG: hypothetical protein WA192_11525 [Candidatus Acidiferrales bacterium]
MIRKIIAPLTVTVGAVIFACFVYGQSRAQSAAAPVGIFEVHQDIGTALHPSSVQLIAGQRAPGIRQLPAAAGGEKPVTLVVKHQNRS